MSGGLLYSPARVALLGIAIWIVIRFVAPVEAVVPLDGAAMLYIFLCYAAFLIGCALPRASAHPHRVPSCTLSAQQPPFQPKLFWFATAAGLGGMAARLYDRVGLRGVDYTLSSAEIRDQLLNSTISPFSLLGAVLLAFCYLPLILQLGAKNTLRRPLTLTVAVIVFSLPALESLGQLSRSVLITSFILAFCAVVCLKFGGHVLDRRVLLPALAGVVGLSLLSTSIFEKRLSDSERVLADSVVESVYAEGVRPTLEAQRGLVSGNTVEATYYAAVVPNSMYYLSGVYEFSQLYTRPDTQQFAWGGLTFATYVRAISALVGSNTDYVDQPYLWKIGVFTSFFGNWWVDFGWAGPVLLIVLGFLCSRLAFAASTGLLNLMPLYLFSICVILLMPVSNTIVDGNGFFIMHAFGLFALFTGIRQIPDDNSRFGQSNE